MINMSGETYWMEKVKAFCPYKDVAQILKADAALLRGRQMLLELVLQTVDNEVNHRLPNVVIGFFLGNAHQSGP
jgi:hypothetical protein